jgi:hypothetical protein
MLSPNPAGDFVKIITARDSCIPKADVSLYDNTGKLVKQSTLQLMVSCLLVICFREYII